MCSTESMAHPERTSMSRKRPRDDDKEETAAQSFPARSFPRAHAAGLAGRRMMRARAIDRRKGYLDAVQSLNRKFEAFISEQVNRSPHETLTDNILEYLAYIRQLDSRYLRSGGDIFTFGSNECNQCGHGSDAAEIPSPRVLYSLHSKNICNIACGALHNIAVTSEGKVYTWGCNDDGALGRAGDEASPLLVSDIRHEAVCGVAAGDSHSTICTLGGVVYAWGCYKDKDGTAFFNADSYTKVKRIQREPIKIANLGNVVEIRAGTSSNLALLSDATAVSWGIGESGELGRAIDLHLRNGPEVESGVKAEYDLYRICKEHLTPRQMQTAGGRQVEGVKTLGVGYNHAFIVMAVGSKVWATGLNNYGQLGLGHQKNVCLLSHVESLDDKLITEITGGAHHSMALAGPTGELWGFGRSDASQLGIGAGSALDAGAFQLTPVQLTFPEEAGTGRYRIVASVSCGGTFNHAVTSQNEVYTWGFGEMGQLGHRPAKGQGSQDESLPRRVELKYAMSNSGEYEILQTDGGAQHSVILARVPSTFLDRVKQR